MFTRRLLAPALLAAVLASAGAADDPPKAAAPGTLVVIDAAGKEQKLTAWKFTTGTRRLAWLAPPAPPPDKDAAPPAKGTPKARPRPAAAGPEALEFREESSTLFVEGVLTFIPLDRLRALDYDAEKETVTARVAAGAKPADDAVLTGTTKFQKINKLALEAEVDKGDLGIAEVKYLGGAARGVRGLRFPPPKAEAPPAGGRPAVVTTSGKQRSTHKVVDLQALYLLPDGRERLSPLLMFKKTLRVDVGKMRKLSASGEEDEGSWQVALKDGGEETLTLLRTAPIDGQEATLEGLLGRVPAGYKLFPPHTIAEVLFDAAEPEAKPEPKDGPG
jgi:hypothetical protein